MERGDDLVGILGFKQRVNDLLLGHLAGEHREQLQMIVRAIAGGTVNMTTSLAPVSSKDSHSIS